MHVVATNSTAKITPATQTPVKMVPQSQPSRTMARMASMTEAAGLILAIALNIVW